MSEGPIKPKDASHILDNEPNPVTVRRPTEVPLTSGGRAVYREDGTPAAIKTTVVDTLTSEEIQRNVVGSVENCGNCNFSREPDMATEKGRAEFKAIEDWIDAQTAQLPGHVRSIRPLGSAAERIICDHPCGAKGLTFRTTPRCEDWKKRRNPFKSYSKPPSAIRKFVRKVNYQIKRGIG